MKAADIFEFARGAPWSRSVPRLVTPEQIEADRFEIQKALVAANMTMDDVAIATICENFPNKDKVCHLLTDPFGLGKKIISPFREIDLTRDALGFVDVKLAHKIFYGPVAVNPSRFSVAPIYASCKGRSRVALIDIINPAHNCFVCGDIDEVTKAFNAKRVRFMAMAEREDLTNEGGISTLEA